jgi:hypothetical protein
MGERGWQVVHAIDERYREGQRRGQPQPWERSRILAGDYSAIVRDFEPETVIMVEVQKGRKEERPGLVAGAVHVLSWSRPLGSVDRAGRALPTPPPAPLLWIEIRKVVPHRKGYWRVLFDVVDRRTHKRLVRRKPPAMPIGDERDPDPELSRVASAYTTNPKEAVDHMDAVDDADLKRFGQEAAQTHMLRTHRSLGARVEQIDALPARERVVALHKLASEQGIDCRDDLKALERRLKRRLGLAA